MKTDIKPAVANVKTNYLGHTETFIYNHLVSQTRYKPIVLAKAIDRLELFPFPDIFKFDFRYTLKNRAILKMLKHDFGEIDLSFLERQLFTKILTENNAKLIHIHFLSEAVSLINSLFGSSLPIVVSCYGYDVTSFPKEEGMLPKVKLVFEVADAFIVLSDYMKRIVMELGCPEEKIHVINHGIRLENYKYIERSQRDNLVLVQIASFYEKKGILYTLEAFNILLKRYPTLKLVLVGDGPLRPAIEDFIDQHSLSEKVQLMGVRPYKELPSILSEADIYVHPSVTAQDGDEEGVSTIHMEAIAVGLPIVSTIHSGNYVTVIDGKTGFLVPERDVQGLVDRTSSLIENPDLRLSFGHEGRLLAENQFNAMIQTAKVEDLYDRLLSEK